MRSARSGSQVGVSEITQLRARLVANPNLGERYINNILAVLSKALRHAADCEVIAKAPKVGLLKVERPEIIAWDSRSTRVSWRRPGPRAPSGTRRYACR